MTPIKMGPPFLNRFILIKKFDMLLNYVKDVK